MRQLVKRMETPREECSTPLSLCGDATRCDGSITTHTHEEGMAALTHSQPVWMHRGQGQEKRRNRKKKKRREEEEIGTSDDYEEDDEEEDDDDEEIDTAAE